MRALLDTNVIIDVLQGRQPWCIDGQRMFLAAASGRFAGCITAKEATDIHYFARKLFKGGRDADRRARQVVGKLCVLFELLDTESSDCKKALSSACSDYEDAVMIETGIRAGVDCIITRDGKDYAVSPIPVYSPADLCAVLDREGGAFSSW